jgi:hypothetical protein
MLLHVFLTAYLYNIYYRKGIKGFLGLQYHNRGILHGTIFYFGKISAVKVFFVAIIFFLLPVPSNLILQLFYSSAVHSLQIQTTLLLPA